jgi:ABC-type nitrate/sulfonate/bicarbonate transport system substrate-binding protein
MRRAMIAWLVLVSLAACASPGSPPAGGAGAPPAPASAGSSGAAPAPAAAAPRPPVQRLVIGVPLPSLSYLPAHVAWKLGFFEEEGLAVEFPQVVGNAIMPALLGGEIDFTTNLSSIGAHAGQGGESKIVQFHSVRLQHVLVVRPEITDVQQLSGKRIAVQSPGTLPAFQVQKLVERYSLRDVALVTAGSEGRAVVMAGAADATVASVPENLLAERDGYPTLLRFATVLDVPQAGLGTSDAILRDKADLVQRALRASARALPLLRGQREDVIRMIADWIELSPEDAARAYNLVIDTYSPNGLPTEAQMRAYLELMQETANVPADATVDRLFDFTLARRVAAELRLPSQ